MQRERDTSYGVTNIGREAQGGGRDGRTKDREAEFRREPGQLTVPAEFMADINAHKFWKPGNTAVF